MTTHNTHHEHSDVDTSTVEHPSASETIVDPTTPIDHETPVTEQGTENVSAPEFSSSTYETVTEQSSASSEPNTENQESSTPTLTSDAVNTNSAEDATPTTEEPDQEPDSNLTLETPEPSLASTETEDNNAITPGTTIEEGGETVSTSTINTETPTTVEPLVPTEETISVTTDNETHTTLEEHKDQVPTQEVPTDTETVITATSKTNTTEINTTDTTNKQPIDTNTEEEHKAQEQQPDETAIVEAREAEVRPFTAFIEEFRQAEAARLQATLRNTNVEGLTLLSTVDGSYQPQTTPEEQTIQKSEAVAAEVVNTETTVSEEQQSETTTSDDVASKDKTPQASTSQDAEKTIEETATPTEQKQTTGKRAVSPLLRPATRIRSGRHSTRQQREVQAAATTETANNTPEKTTETPITSSTSSEQTSENNSVPTEQPAPPKTRRYRFDRPASLATSAASSNGTQASSRVSTGTAAQSRNTSTTQNEETRATTTSLTSSNTKEQPVTTPAAEATPTVTSSTSQANTSKTTQEPAAEATTPTEQTTSRRRHAHKEQTNNVSQNTQPVAETTPTPTAPTGEIAPEDLPPLEYSELQKANSRRRRRRHSSSNNNNNNNNAQQAQQAQQQPAQPPEPPQQPILPPAPLSPAGSQPRPNIPNSSVYSIVSGYTLNQMNQGGDISGPFMGPEPSPARGSVYSRESRNANRAEIQRATTGSAAQSRASDGGFNAAAVTQFANVVSQAIQTQTDRMVAELRRANQSPTNVTVSLPPFPSTERVGVFVVVANLLYSARTLRIAVDFGKLLDFLRGNRRLVRAHAYCPTSPQANDDQMFLQAVKGLGYRITTKNYKTFSSGAKKADLDLDLCMDVVRLVDGRSVDCIVLVSGDSDFMPMLDYCSDHGVRVEVAAFDEAMSATLRQSCDLFVYLSMLEEIRA